MQNIEHQIQKIIELEQERQNCDSKSREKEINNELRDLYPDSFNGSLVTYRSQKGEIKKGRIWHNYFGVFSVYGQNKHHFTWSSNYENVFLDQIAEWLPENNSDLEKSLSEIDGKIYALNKEIAQLEREKRELCKDIFPYVDPSSFTETEEINRSAFSLGGGPVYISEAFCQITGERITS